MKTKSGQAISLGFDDSQAIAKALYVYAEAAYPPGGSECSQASNQSLKQLAERLLVAHKTPIMIKKRQLPMIKSAIRWFYSPESAHLHEEAIDCERLIRQLTGD